MRRNDDDDDDDKPQEEIMAVRHREAFLQTEEELSKQLTAVARSRLVVDSNELLAKHAQEAMFDRRQEMYIFAFTSGLVTRSLIDVFAPKHNRLDCDDETMPFSNGRCPRCTLLHALAHPHSLDCDIKIEFAVSIDRRTDGR